MTINIQNASNVTVNGTNRDKHCKPVYCITTGEMYASALDAAEANGVTHSSMSFALTGRTKTCNGKRFCYVARMMEYLEEINQANHERIVKVAAYDAENERRNALKNAEADVQKCTEKVEDLRLQLSEAETALNHAKARLYELKNND